MAIARSNIDQIPWVEKYRPKNLNSIIEQDEIVKVLKHTLETGELPHLLLYGPPGTGKTSTIVALCYELFGPELFKDRVLELNASDDRGIGIVRERIISFSKMTVGRKDPNYPCPNFKIVILDEADAMTPEAQSALRQVMERNSRITRFCFVCNYINKIIAPIISRCMNFRFKPIGRNAIISRLSEIAANEGLDVNTGHLEIIYEFSDGDARNAIMSLQNLKYITQYSSSMTSTDIVQLLCGSDDEQITQFGLWDTCMNGTIPDIVATISNICREGISYKNILNYIHKKLISSNLTDHVKSQISIVLGETEERLVNGSSEYIQLLNLGMSINKAVKEN